MANNRGKSVDCYKNLCYNNINMDNVKLLSIEDTAGTLGVSKSAVYNFINGGKLEAIKLGSRTMVRMADLLKFVESRSSYLGVENDL